MISATVLLEDSHVGGCKSDIEGHENSAHRNIGCNAGSTTHAGHGGWVGASTLFESVEHGARVIIVGSRVVVEVKTEEGMKSGRKLASSTKKAQCMPYKRYKLCRRRFKKRSTDYKKGKRS